MLLDAATPPIKAHGPTPLDVCVCVCVYVCVCVCDAYPGTKHTLVFHHAQYQNTVLCSSVKSLFCRTCVKSSSCKTGAHLSLDNCVVPQACSYLLLATMAS